MRPLEGKVALISGTGGGQGRAAALAFARDGARVMGCDVKAEDARETVRLVQGAGGTMRSLEPLDVSDPEQAEQWVNAAIAEWGGIDILYNNAGSLHARRPFGESTLEEWDLTIRYELTIVYVCCRAAWPHLVRRGEGVIINTASVSGHFELLPLRTAAHGATKAGVMGLTRMLCAEGAQYGIRAVSVSPGLIRSPSTERFWTGNDAERATGAAIAAKIPAGRPGACEEIAEVAAFLASSRASYINGADVLVDGGLKSVSFSPLL